MKVQIFCAKCGEPLQSKLGEGFNGLVSIYSKRSPSDALLYVAPCEQCTDVGVQVNKIIAKAYDSIANNGE